MEPVATPGRPCHEPAAAPAHWRPVRQRQFSSRNGRRGESTVDHRYRAYLFDWVDTMQPASVRAMNARVAACYAWADTHRVRVLDEVIAWADGARPPSDVLTELAERCAREGAALLVYSSEAVPEEWEPGLSADRTRVGAEGGPVRLLTAAATWWVTG